LFSWLLARRFIGHIRSCKCGWRITGDMKSRGTLLSQVLGAEDGRDPSKETSLRSTEDLSVFFPLLQASQSKAQALPITQRRHDAPVWRWNPIARHAYRPCPPSFSASFSDVRWKGRSSSVSTSRAPRNGEISSSRDAIRQSVDHDNLSLLRQEWTCHRGWLLYGLRRTEIPAGRERGFMGR
jgi:hypothetical protein